MRLKELIKIEGKISNLVKEDSKVQVFENYDSQIVGSAILGSLAESSSLLANAPMMMIAKKGLDAVSFKGELQGYQLIGQYTKADFNENDQLIAVISDDSVNGSHLAYAVLNPKNGLLYMMYGMGRSKKQGRKLIFKLTLMFSLIVTVVMDFLILGYYLLSSNNEDLFYVLKLCLAIPFFSFIGIYLIIFLGMKGNYDKNGVVSERTLKELGFDDTDNIDFSKYFIMNNIDGTKIGVMEYRKGLKGRKDPYPSDYFDKKEE
nr:putative type VI secretion system effector [Acinetobacter sp. Marseille-Q1620]